MQIKPEQLERQLQSGQPPCCLISGEETLIVQECADQFRRAARANGCSEREIIEISKVSDWQDLLQSAGAMSLFAERKLIELRLPTGKPGAEGSKAIQEYLKYDSDDVLLIVSGKIDKQSQRAKWYTALDKAGIVVPVWPIAPRELPRWLGDRLQAAGLRADREAVQLLAERVEGNLLAAAQEVEKLKLLADGTVITAETIVSGVLDNARYNSFGLVDTALSGDARGALRGLRGLEAEATQPSALLWVIARDVRLLTQLQEDCQRGSNLGQAINQRGVWRSRAGLVQSAFQRQSEASIEQLQSLLLTTDSAIKGFGPGNPWDYLDQLVILLAQGSRQSGTYPSSNNRRRA